MIVGTGVDLIAVDRIARALEHPTRGTRFRAKVFTAAEIAYCDRRRNAAQSYAARFAAKEAVMKALGAFFPWRDIEVIRGAGPPQIRLSGRAAHRARELGVTRFLLSLAHTREFAIASVVAER